MQIAMIQDRIVPFDDLDPVYLDRGLYFGDGVYEVLRTYHGIPFALEEHLDRFSASLAAVGIEGVERARVRAAVLQALEASGLAQAKVYFHVTRGMGPRDLFGKGPHEPTFFLTVMELGDSSADKARGIRVSTYPDLRWKRCDIKSLNLLPNVLARRDALHKGCDEAILVNESGLITEGAASSFFAVLERSTGAGGTEPFLQTAPLTANILPSVTRLFLIRAARELGIPVLEEQLTPEQAAGAKELIMAVTTKDVVPIVQFDGHPIGAGAPGPVTLDLAQAFKGFIV
ncbi:MAG: aminotransferase class IV [Phycisphaerae bacterium]|nr:aminotransferase class IV [Phycisphaerae bacterium]